MMMVSSHLRNSRITLPMGFSAQGSCGNCSAALMGISPNYFSEHLGVYRPVLAALESLNRAVLTAMDATKLEYEQASKVDQFVTRFLLRETVSQLQALQSSLEGASDTLEAQARGARSDEESVEAQSRPRGSWRAGRRALKSISRSPSWSPGSSDIGRSSEAERQWRLQVNRLQELIDQLECKAPRLEPLHEEDLAKGPDSGWASIPWARWTMAASGSAPGDGRGGWSLVCPGAGWQQEPSASTSLWPRDRSRWQRKPCRTSTEPCAATWTSQGPRAIVCMCLHRRCWTAPPSRCMSSGGMRPPGEGTSSRPAVRPSSAPSLTTCGLRTPSALCSSQPPGGLWIITEPDLRNQGPGGPACLLWEPLDWSAQHHDRGPCLLQAWASLLAQGLSLGIRDWAACFLFIYHSVLCCL
ncbi:N-terminal EF-hand calcium-binding protein 3 isoform X2 [Lemur catta]|uniref:N-terminal EF-hand calcium-binding protein 3 isoform X2 n=1 Tax=Lemur catta TaxID=9447 RepID=UPI001E26AD08|nr:N-terminal EF-hand calcium-binding protein 3 isoform X2 [Lemur catta]